MTAAPPRPNAVTHQDIVTNLKRFSVQAGMAGGALTAAFGAFQAAAHIHLPPPVFILTGALTAAGVFAGRMWPQNL